MTAGRSDSSEWGRWLEFASDDLAFGESGMAVHPRPAAWNFQQAAEKALKAVLLAKGMEVPRTHDMAFLLSMLTESIPAANDLRDNVLALAAITSASRYPDDGLDVSALDDANLALAARNIVHWAKRLCAEAGGDVANGLP